MVKVNMRNFIIFLTILALVFIGILFSGKINFGKTVYVVSPKDNIDNEQNIEERINDEDSVENEKVEIDENSKIVVYISGEVNTCGVVNVSNGDRLIDAVEKLGGLTEYADLNKVNLAIKLEDGCHYIIPKIGEYIQQEEITSSKDIDKKYNNYNANNNNNSSKININTASKEELNSLPGIGNVIAARIIEYRNQNRRFSSINDIKNVSGIGDKKFEGIKDLIITN